MILVDTNIPRFLFLYYLTDTLGDIYYVRSSHVCIQITQKTPIKLNNIMGKKYRKRVTKFRLIGYVYTRSS